MAQISKINYSDVLEAHRFDAEYFKPEYLEIEKKLNTLKHSILYKYCNFCKKGIFDISPKYYRKKGIPLIRTSEIKHPLVDFSTTVFIDEEIHKLHNKTELEVGDIVFTKIGAYIGDVSILPPSFYKYNFSQNVAGLSIKKDKISPYFLLVFLLSKYSKKQILRITMLSGQGKLELKDIKNLKIPILPQQFQLQIETIVKSAYQKQSLSKQLYHEAEELLLAELGLLDYQVNHSLTFETTKREVDEARRFDGEYFQPKYKEIIEKIENYDGGFDFVKNQFKQNTVLSKKDREYYTYIEISDVNISNGEITPTKRELNDIPANGKRKLFKNDLLVSKVRPYRGAVAIIDFEEDNLLGSGAFTVLQEKTEYKKEVLMIFLKTIFIKELLLRYNCGTSYPVIKDDDILNLKIPLINPKIQKQISEKILESHKLRKESKDLLEEAKRKVEEEIEKEAKK